MTDDAAALVTYGDDRPITYCPSPERVEQVAREVCELPHDGPDWPCPSCLMETHRVLTALMRLGISLNYEDGPTDRQAP